MGRDAQPVVITVAPTEAEATREDNPALPHTPLEMEVIGREMIPA